MMEIQGFGARVAGEFFIGTGHREPVGRLEAGSWKTK
jgi:hypothetical protein